MLVGADIPADKEGDFNKWYQEEHLQELLSVPGILNAARYEATKSGPKHLAVYELESVDVIETDAFKNRPRTDWGSRVSPNLIGTNFFNIVLDMIHPTSLRMRLQTVTWLRLCKLAAWMLRLMTKTNGTSGTVAFTCLIMRSVLVSFEVDVGSPFAANRNLPQFMSLKTRTSQRQTSGQQREIHPDNVRMRDIMTHASGSPGIGKKNLSTVGGKTY
ncbi:MAG: hypothetical protein CM1200mP27_09320 [Chloroflexota bacterium]|nr:MAG: hypothetical protein CM1200mP27_09320 [Chloroflexota bacterium]